MRYGRLSSILSIGGLLWFVICFTAKEASWWNSLWFFLLIFLSAVLLGIVDRRRPTGIMGIILGGLGLFVVGALLYIR
jgi:hypothetical membrane protein